MIVATQMNSLLATVLNVDKQGSEYFVTVEVGRENYRGTFDQLNFGKNKPHHGWYDYGWLELVYHRDPALKAGQAFALWTIP